jgi:hypothetical protein
MRLPIATQLASKAHNVAVQRVQVTFTSPLASFDSPMQQRC